MRAQRLRPAAATQSAYGVKIGPVMTEHAAAPLAEDEAARRTARLEKLTALYGDPFRVTHFAKTHAAEAVKNEHANLAAGEKTAKRVSVAGRIMAIRNGGMFIVILDDTDR